jgi:putative transposase
MGELRGQVEYKTGWSGVRLHIADTWYPSSKTCSSCGAVKTELRLSSERTCTCGQCGFTLDRDLNAARNLAALVGESRAVVAASCVVTARWKHMSDPPRPAVGSGYCHGKTPGQRPHRKARTQDTVSQVS